MISFFLGWGVLSKERKCPLLLMSSLLSSAVSLHRRPLLTSEGSLPAKWGKQNRSKFAKIHTTILSHYYSPSPPTASKDTDVWQWLWNWIVERTTLFLTGDTASLFRLYVKLAAWWEAFWPLPRYRIISMQPPISGCQEQIRDFS